MILSIVLVVFASFISPVLMLSFIAPVLMVLIFSIVLVSFFSTSSSVVVHSGVAVVQIDDHLRHNGLRGNHGWRRNLYWWNERRNKKLGRLHPVLMRRGHIV